MNFEARDRLSAALGPLIETQGLRAYARSIGITSGAVSKWLEGDSFPNGDNRERVARSLGMSLEEFDSRIVKGKEHRPTDDPLEAQIGMIMSLPPSELARLLMAIADRLKSYDTHRTMHYPMAADKAAEHEAGGCRR